MRLGRRLRESEEGNVLYLTLIMMMLLVGASLVLVNMVQVVMIKIKAQQAADHMVLSAATLKARVLNDLANTNSFITGLLAAKGTAASPFSGPSEQQFWTETMADLQRMMAEQLQAFNQDPANGMMLDNMAQANGLSEQRSTVKLFPLDMVLGRDLKIDLQECYVRTAHPPYFTTCMLPAVIEPEETISVQARLVWRAKTELIGHRLFKVNMPDMVVKARAELYDDGILQNSLGRSWKVRLVPPLDSIDRYLEQQ